MEHTHLAFGIETLPPQWLLKRPKGALRSLYDLLGAPLRMVLLPDRASERLGLTSLRAERMGEVLPHLKGRVLDIGAGDNALVRLYKKSGASLSPNSKAPESVGVDTTDWGGGCVIVKSSEQLPFPDASFDTVCFIACLNHIPERQQALHEAHRLLRPGGRLIMTMISRFLGEIGHKIWWYSEEKHRHVDEEEAGGLDPQEIVALLEATGFKLTSIDRFTYRLNTLYIAEPR